MMTQSTVSELKGRGCIINVSSVLGIEGSSGSLVYAASKGAIIGMTLPLARDLGRSQIRVNAIAPSLIRTAMTAPNMHVTQSKVEQQAALGRIGYPSDFTDLVVAVVDSLYVNGAVVRLDGGARVGM